MDWYRKNSIAYFPPGVRKMNAYAIHGSGSGRRYESLYPASADVKNPDFHRLEFSSHLTLKPCLPCHGVNHCHSTGRMLED
ncbi:hypothetical protein OS493_023688 [Desmophyllum pertusum]|uniref:Uncharacterized protein n=1 Tax=Desmophyllum pertusum TaxID=174260 RepID=A0A9W9YYG3_9CNID|nr:hypothetical protein OS493_023688 [Desmophyllum pertusum]